MLQNSRVTALTVSELLREIQQGVKLAPIQNRVNAWHCRKKPLLNQSVNYAEIFEFNYFELIYYIFIKNCCRYFKVKKVH